MKGSAVRVLQQSVLLMQEILDPPAAVASGAFAGESLPPAVPVTSNCQLCASRIEKETVGLETVRKARRRCVERCGQIVQARMPRAPTPHLARDRYNTVDLPPKRQHSYIKPPSSPLSEMICSSAPVHICACTLHLSSSSLPGRTCSIEHLGHLNRPTFPGMVIMKSQEVFPHLPGRRRIRP